MIFVINLEEMEAIDFNLYKALEYMWNNDGFVTQYSKIGKFKKRYLDHVTDMNGNNWVGIIDTEKQTCNTVNIDVNIVVSGLEIDDFDDLIEQE